MLDAVGKLVDWEPELIKRRKLEENVDRLARELLAGLNAPFPAELPGVLTYKLL